MAIQLSVSVRNDRLDTIDVGIGYQPIIRIRSGTPPAGCSSADTGTMLAELSLPSGWLTAANNGSVDKVGTWQTDAADTGTAGHFRIYGSGGANCHMQGTITEDAGGGDMEVENTEFNTGQQFTITTFTLTEGSA